MESDRGGLALYVGARPQPYRGMYDSGVTRSEIISKMTCILEDRFSRYLLKAQKALRIYTSHQFARASMLEVNALLKRLRQAERYQDFVGDNVIQLEKVPVNSKKDDILEILER